METNRSSSSSEGGPFALISKGWREVRESATNDLKLMKSRADSLLEISELKRFQPKISELRRTCSSALEGWDGSGSEQSTVRIDLSAIRRVFEERKNGFGGVDRRLTMIGLVVKENQDVNSREEIKEWVPIQRIKARWKEIEQKKLRTDVFDSWKGSQFVEKIKLSLRSIHKLPHKSKDDQDFDLDLRIGFKPDSPKVEGPNRKTHVSIITTASLPWMTGTAVNPLFRAAYLAKSTNQNVTLLIPWLNKSDQELVYPDGVVFENTDEQEGYIRNWLSERVGFEADFRISFYPGKFSKERRSIIPMGGTSAFIPSTEADIAIPEEPEHLKTCTIPSNGFSKERRSIIPMGDTSAFIPSEDADVAILEEPEHLNWYHHGKNWTDKFNRVIGVIHTNYLEYIKRERNGWLQAFLVKHINNWVTRAYCHKVLRLSAATQDLPKSVICNVHGVNPKFLTIGAKIAAQLQNENNNNNNKVFSKDAYFLGKMVWAKGYRELLDLLAKHKHELRGLSVDLYGNGEDSTTVQLEARKLDLDVRFFKGRDHSDESLHSYKVFINPSVSDVLCTATAEALAMGKFVICADHPSNEFFKQFPNCFTYKTSDEFVTKVNAALTSQPSPLTREQMYELSWEAATQRFLECSELDEVIKRGRMGRKRWRRSQSGLVDGVLAMLHYCLTGSEMVRLLTGAEPGTRDFDKGICEDMRLLAPVTDHKREEILADHWVL